MRGIDGDLSEVAWSQDGRFLYAGGKYGGGSTSPIVRWAAGGQGARTELAATSSTLMQILPLRDGGAAFAGTDPAFGVYSADDRKVLYKGPDIAEFRGLRERLLVSADGAVVQWGMNFSANHRRSSPLPSGC